MKNGSRIVVLIVAHLLGGSHPALLAELAEPGEGGGALGAGEDPLQASHLVEPRPEPADRAHDAG